MDAGAATDAFFEGASPEGRARYTDVQLIGQGAYSVVARATDSRKNMPVAIKRISEVFYDAHEAKKVLREIRLLRDFRHPNIIWLHALVPPASMETFNDIWIVTDYMDGDLRRIIKSRREIEPLKVRLYMAQLIAALHHVHALDSIHRDLKPANVLVSRKGNLKLCDFGLARTVKQNHGTEVEQEGAPVDPSKPPPLVPQMTNYVVTRWYARPDPSPSPPTRTSPQQVLLPRRNPNAGPILTHPTCPHQVPRARDHPAAALRRSGGHLGGRLHLQGATRADARLQVQDGRALPRPLLHPLLLRRRPQVAPPPRPTLGTS